MDKKNALVKFYCFFEKKKKLNYPNYLQKLLKKKKQIRVDRWFFYPQTGKEVGEPPLEIKGVLNHLHSL